MRAEGPPAAREEGLILGVDPGSVATGWGLVGGSGARPALIEAGVIRMAARLPFAERLHRLRCEFEGLLLRLRPAEAAVEAPFHGPNSRAALQLAHARGDIRSGYQRLSNQDCVYPAYTIPAQAFFGRAFFGQERHIFCVVDAALRHQCHACRDVPTQCAGGLQADPERIQIAVVHPYQTGLQRQYGFQLSQGVHLHHGGAHAPFLQLAAIGGDGGGDPGRRKEGGSI